MNRRVAVRAIVEDNGKILAVQLKPYRGSVILDEPYWCTVGGGIDEGEAMIPALEREVLEETGVKASVGNLLYIQQFIHGETEQLEFFFHITNPDDFKNIDLTLASHAEEEIEKIEFIDPKLHNVLPKFLTEVDIAEDIRSNGPTKIINYL